MSRFDLAAGTDAVLGVLSEFNDTSVQFRARRRAAVGSSPHSKDSVPVLLVPGILGTAMVDPKHRNFPVWGSYRGSLFYRRKYDDLDLPVVPGGKNRLQPGGIVWKFTVAPGLINLPVYENFKQSLIYSGYQMGSLEKPTCKRGLYAVQYDWRCEIVTVARAIASAVDTLRRSLGVEKVRLVGHSWGCIACRYYIRYGGADVLSDSPEEPCPGGPNISTFFAVAPPFGGSMRAFHSLQHGYSPGIAFWRPVASHHVSSSPAAYQLMRYDPDMVVDETGQRVPLDFADAGVWKKLQWGPYGRHSFEALYERAKSADSALSREEMSAAIDALLTSFLKRAKRLGELMSKPNAEDKAVRTVAYTSRNKPTLFKLVLKSNGGAPRFLTTETAVRRHVPGLVDRVVAPGDEHVTFSDILKHSGHKTVITCADEVPEESYVLATPSRSHRSLFNTDAVLTNLLLNLRRRT